MDNFAREKDARDILKQIYLIGKTGITHKKEKTH